MQAKQTELADIESRLLRLEESATNIQAHLEEASAEVARAMERGAEVGLPCVCTACCLLALCALEAHTSPCGLCLASHMCMFPPWPADSRLIPQP